MNKPISLISELVIIDHGKYIVKVSANRQGVILGTGLAAADTIELAEDRARERALAIVDFSISPQQATSVSQAQPETISSPPQTEVKSSSSVNVINSVIPETPINSESKSVSQPESKTVEKMETKSLKPPLSQPENQQNPTPKLDLKPSAKSPSELPLDSLPTVENKVAKSSLDKTAKQESVIENLDNSHSSKKNEETESPSTLPIEFPSETPESDTEKESPSTLPIEFPPETPESDTEKESPSTLPIEFPPKIPESDTEKENETLAQPQQFEDKQQEEDKTQEKDLSSNNVIDFPVSNPSEKPVINNQESPSYNFEETMDFTQIIDETTIEMKRLNWTHDQGIQYLLETYGKKSRHLLSDEELIEFLNYLKTQ